MHPSSQNSKLTKLQKDITEKSIYLYVNATSI